MTLADGRPITERRINYDPYFDGPSLRFSVFVDGVETFTTLKFDGHGRSVRLAREQGRTALEVAVKAGRTGEIK